MKELTDSVELEVTAEDIQEGKKRNCKLCPVARAAARALEGWEVDVVNFLHVYAPGHIHKAVYALPEEAREFIWKFDYGAPVEPIRFQVVRVGE